MKSGLVLAGDRSKEAAMSSYMKLGIATIAMGILILVCSLYMIVSKPYIHSLRSLRYADNVQFLVVCLGAFGMILIIAGIATPFLAVYQSQKCFIDVYEDCVEGAYLVKQKGSVDQYVPFQLPYSKIDGVSFQKNKVFIQTASGTFVCFAFNASEICGEIRKRCVQE